MKEIGGYFEYETYRGRMLHEEGILLNCGRNCLAYLIKVRDIKKILIPYFMCDSVLDTCRNNGVDLRFYNIDKSLNPVDIDLKEDEWLYLMSYYGQLTTDTIQEVKDRYGRVIVDFAHDYFRDQIDGLDTIYTCRKFFGVTDGAVLITDARKLNGLETDESYERLRFIAGRYERNASEFYQDAVANNDRYDIEPIKSMSKLTYNILKSLDYDYIKKRRTDNYAYLHERLRGINKLELRLVKGAYAYPLLIKNGASVRKKLAERKIYVATLWPNVLDLPKNMLEHELAENILPLPCDHRYTEDDMEVVVEAVKETMSEGI